MPAPCRCGFDCGCVIVGDGNTVTVTGSGTLADPYLVTCTDVARLGEPERPITNPTAIRPAIPNVWWNTTQTPTAFDATRDVQMHRTVLAVAPGAVTQRQTVATVTLAGLVSTLTVPGASQAQSVGASTLGGLPVTLVRQNPSQPQTVTAGVLVGPPAAPTGVTAV